MKQTKIEQYGKRIDTITKAVKLWEGLEGQKLFNRDQPRIVTILDHAITALRFEIILAARNKQYLWENK